MHFRHSNGQLVYGTPKAMGLLLAENSQAEFVELTLCKGGNIPSHALDIPVSFYVVSGQGTVAVDGAESALVAGDVVTSEAGTCRELTNTGDCDFKILVVKHRG